MFRQLFIFFTVVTLVLGTPLKFHHPGGRIVGGNETTIEENPWQVSIQIMNMHDCGGSIIGRDVILTAAHCIDTFWILYLYDVVAGTTDLSDEKVTVGIADTIVHENYSESESDYDVALIKLTQELTFGDTIQPVKLPEQDDTPQTGTTVTVTGWGSQSEDDTATPNILRTVNVTVVDHDECATDYTSISEITDRMLCAGEPEGGKDSCQGDSGGPLTINGTLYGIVSWGNGCAEKGYPGVYTNVAAVRNWIKENSGI